MGNACCRPQTDEKIFASYRKEHEKSKRSLEQRQSAQMGLDVLASAKFIASEAQDIHINDVKVDEVAERISSEMVGPNAYTSAAWSGHDLHPKTTDESTLNWIFTVDLLNFSFYSDIDTIEDSKFNPDRFSITYKNEKYTGYWSLCAVINRALDKDIPITSPLFWLRASENELKAIFSTDTPEQFPMLHDRIRVLREAGRFLADNYQGRIALLIQQSQNSAQIVIRKLTTGINSFNDVSNYHGQRVAFYKRAQIFVADVWAAFSGKYYGNFNDIDSLTMFADYRVPQLLENLGVLIYSANLRQKLLNFEAPTSNEECEIRGCVIYACELIRLSMANRGIERPVILIDFYLWDLAKTITFDVPHHRIRSVFY